MNIKLTFRYLLSIAIVAVIVVLINITIIYLSLYSKNTNSLIKYDGNNKITSFVRNFEKYIDLDEDNRLYIDNNGKDLIDNSNSWVQILDENNKEVYSYNKPQEIKNKYTPIDIINGYKYTEGDRIELWSTTPENIRISGKLVEKNKNYTEGSSTKETNKKYIDYSGKS